MSAVFPKSEKPFQYKAPFSPADVIEEYTRPARLMENGFIVTRPALSEVEWIHFDEVGTLEAFNTDGLRSLLFYHAAYPQPEGKDSPLSGSCGYHSLAEGKRFLQ